MTGINTNFVSERTYTGKSIAASYANYGGSERQKSQEPL